MTSEVVWWDAGCHAHGDALGPIDQEVGEPGRQYDRFRTGGIVVEPRVNGAIPEFGHQLFGDGRQPGLGVASCRGSHAHHRAKVALPVDQRVTQREVLGHTDQGFIDRCFSMGVIVAGRIAADFHRLARLGVGRKMQVVIHREENATLDRFQSIADVGQGPGLNHREGIIEVTSAGFLAD